MIQFKYPRLWELYIEKDNTKLRDDPTCEKQERFTGKYIIHAMYQSAQFQVSNTEIFYSTVLDRSYRNAASSLFVPGNRSVSQLWKTLTNELFQIF